jgi:5-(carboxyamino)imidazole ribonucleotide mutase
MPDVCVIAGSISDKEVVAKCTTTLNMLGIPYEVHIASAHKTPDMVQEIVSKSDAEVFIAIAGLSAALPGVVSALTIKPVIGVPCSGKISLDAILSIVQMPQGVPVACVSLDGGTNAALLAARILAIKNPELTEKLQKYKMKLIEDVKEQNKKLQE